MMEECLALQRWLAAGLQAAGLKVHDVPPGDAQPPYLSLGPDSTADWGWKGGGGTEHRLVVTLWTGRDGMERTKAMLSDVEEVIAGLPRTIAGIRIVTLRVLRGQVKRNPRSWTAGRLELLVRTIKETM